MSSDPSVGVLLARWQEWMDRALRVYGERPSDLQIVQMSMAREFVGDLEYLTGYKACGFCLSGRKGAGRAGQDASSRKVCRHRPGEGLVDEAVIIAERAGAHLTRPRRRQELPGQLPLFQPELIAA